MTFPEHDHLDMVGFNPSYNPVNIYTLAVDNIRLAEIKNDPAEARQYGVDHFFAWDDVKLTVKVINYVVFK